VRWAIVGLSIALSACASERVTGPQLEPAVVMAVAPPADVIVLLRGGDARALGHAHGATHIYTSALKGFSARLSTSAVTALARNPNVLSIETDGVVYLAQAPWHLDRLDTRTLAFNGAYATDRTGAGVNAYVIDNGVRATHSEFGGRVLTELSFAGGAGGCGHATHVAALLGGFQWGAAKGVSLHSLNVFPSCTESTAESNVIAAVDWVTANAVRPAVVNMSIEGPPHTALNLAVANSIASGLPYTVAAGNGDVDACNFSPGMVSAAITVGATNANDRKWVSSNHGSCVDIFAPGSGVTSAWHTSDTDSAQLSGTSMATPLVAGVAALYLEGRPTALPAEVQDSLKAYSSRSVVSDAESANCNLLYSGRAVQSGRIRKCPR
jgi:subtilisin family serine protease